MNFLSRAHLADPLTGLPLRALGNVVRHEQTAVSCESAAGTVAAQVFAARIALHGEDFPQGISGPDPELVAQATSPVLKPSVMCL